MKNLRTLSLILALLFIFAALASCAEEPITETTGTQPQESTSAEGDETTEPDETTKGGNETTEPGETTEGGNETTKPGETTETSETTKPADITENTESSSTETTETTETTDTESSETENGNQGDNDAISPKDGAEIVLANDDVYGWWKGYDYTKTGYTEPFHEQKADLYFPNLVFFSWEANEAADHYQLYISTDKDFAPEKTESYLVNENSLALDHLFTGTKYYWKVTYTAISGENNNENNGVSVAARSFTTAESPRCVRIDGVSNTRDIGGLTVAGGKKIKQGMIYRGALLEGITDEGKDYFLNCLGLKTDLDLRTPGEGGAGSGSPLGNGVNYVNINGRYYVGGKGISNTEGMLLFAEEIRIFTNPDNYPIYFHCSLGRDRTGTLAFVLEALLGADKNTLMMDYELSAFSVRGTWDTATVTDAKKNITLTYNYINDNYEGDTFAQKTENYLLSIGITAEEIQAIKNIMLEDVETSEPDGSACTHNWAPATCRSPKTCKNCGETQGEALGHNFGEAVDGVKTCSSCGAKECAADAHVIVETVVDFNTTKIIRGNCTTCFKTVYLSETTFGETRPLKFLLPADIAAKAASGNKIGGAEISEDKTYVTISNIVGEGTGFFFPIDGGSKGTNAGQYILVKYRTNSADYWLWYVKTAGQDGYGTIKVYPIADGEWHTIIIDLSKTPNNRYVPNEDGEYLAHVIRWDLMTVASSQSKSVDVQYIATADNLDALSAINNATDCIIYDRINSGVMEIDPEKHTAHVWSAATCTSPKSCVFCTETEGAALGHDWKTVDGVETCDRCGQEKGDLPVYFNATLSNNVNKVCNKKPLVSDGGVTTSTGKGGLLYFYGWGGTLGEVDFDAETKTGGVKYRVLNANGDVLEEWRYLNQYIGSDNKAYPIFFECSDMASGSETYLSKVQKNVPDATHAYLVRGNIDLTEYLGDSVTVEIAFTMKDAPVGEELFTFMTLENVEVVN